MPETPNIVVLELDLHTLAKSIQQALDAVEQDASNPILGTIRHMQDPHRAYTLAALFASWEQLVGTPQNITREQVDAMDEATRAAERHARLGLIRSQVEAVLSGNVGLTIKAGA